MRKDPRFDGSDVVLITLFIFVVFGIALIWVLEKAEHGARFMVYP